MTVAISSVEVRCNPPWSDSARPECLSGSAAIKPWRIYPTLDFAERFARNRPRAPRMLRSNTRMSQDRALEMFAEGRLGTVLNGKWTLVKLLGVGGMAAVYEARHRNRKRAAI